MVLGCILLAQFGVWLKTAHIAGYDASTPDQNWVYSGGAEGGSVLLSAIASSNIGVAGTTFSIAALTLASGQMMGPRLLRNFIRDARNQTVLGIFLGAFAYSLMVLRTVRTVEETPFVPHLASTGAMVLALIAIGTLVWFVHHIATSINIETVVDAVHVDAHMRLAAGASDLATSRAAFDTSQADLAASRSEHAASAATLVDERVTAELREQFIAVLGHDLRNSLASIDSGAKLLARENPSERERTVLDLLAKSVGRMVGLIDDVLDFARGRLAVEKAGRVPLAPMLRQVVAEIEGGHPDSRIEVDLDGVGECRRDPTRIGQLLSNLLANAVTHGAPDSPVQVRGATSDSVFELAVTNSGEPIPPAAMAGLFKPYVRASERPSKQGLGLGLYIASEIAKAHGGTPEAVSTPDAATFTFRMPA